MYDGKRKPMTVKRSIFIGIIVAITQVILDYALIKANMVGTFNVKQNIIRFIILVILAPIVLIVIDKFERKYAKF